MIAVGMEFSKADTAAWQAQMNRLINVLGTEPKIAVRMGAVALLTSMRASTAKSKVTAPVRVSKSGKNRLVGGKKIYTVERYDRSGKLMRRAIFANSLAEAKQNPSAKIRYSGLARASWGWSMKRLFNKGAPRVNFREPRDILDATATGTGRDYTVNIENRLDYISKSFNSGRGPAVSTAMRRATGAMKGRIDKRLKGARW